MLVQLAKDLQEKMKSKQKSVIYNVEVGRRQSIFHSLVTFSWWYPWLFLFTFSAMFAQIYEAADLFVLDLAKCLLIRMYEVVVAVLSPIPQHSLSISFVCLLHTFGPFFSLYRCYVATKWGNNSNQFICSLEIRAFILTLKELNH